MLVFLRNIQSTERCSLYVHCIFNCCCCCSAELLVLLLLLFLFRIIVVVIAWLVCYFYWKWCKNVDSRIFLQLLRWMMDYLIFLFMEKFFSSIFSLIGNFLLLFATQRGIQEERELNMCVIDSARILSENQNKNNPNVHWSLFNHFIQQISNSREWFRCHRKKKRFSNSRIRNNYRSIHSIAQLWYIHKNKSPAKTTTFVLFTLKRRKTQKTKTGQAAVIHIKYITVVSFCSLRLRISHIS